MEKLFIILLADFINIDFLLCDGIIILNLKNGDGVRRLNRLDRLITPTIKKGGIGL